MSGVRRIDHQMSLLRNLIKGLHQGCLVQESHLVGQLDASELSTYMTLGNLAQWTPHIAVKNEAYGNDHANENADQQIGDDNGDDCKHEREKLLTPSKPHLFEGGWTCQFETSVHQDGSKAGKGNAIEQVGEEGYRRE